MPALLLDARVGLPADNVFRFLTPEPITLSVMAIGTIELLTASEIEAKRIASK